MSKKVRGVGFDSKPLYDEDAKVWLKHQTLVQEYVELQEETDVMRSKLEAAKHRKRTLAAEVRFLRKRFKFLMETKEQEQKLVKLSSSLQQTKAKKEKPLTTKEFSHHRLPPKPEPKLKKRRYLGEEVAIPSTSNQHHNKKLRGGKETNRLNLTPISVLNYRGRMNINHEKLARKAPIFDLNQNGIMQGVNDTAALKKSSIAGFDLNQDISCSGKEASLRTRAPIFDLNEISTGDEDFQNFPSNGEASKFKEAKKSLLRGLNDDQQNDLNLSICRNAGESSSSFIGKRKISWQDPVALRV